MIDYLTGGNGAVSPLPPEQSPVEKLFVGIEERLAVLAKKVADTGSRVAPVSLARPSAEGANKAEMKAVTSPFETRLEQIQNSITKVTYQLDDICNALRV